MTTLYISHPAYLNHLTPVGHPERPDRMRAIEQVMGHDTFDDLRREDAPQAGVEAIAAAHPAEYVAGIEAAVPETGTAYIDMDTSMSPGSWEAATRGAGAAIMAVDEVMGGKADNAFCAVRPPGHHAETARAMGFCLFNNVAVAAFHARNAHGAERIAVVDFDVHHGNGTQDIFWNDKDLFFGSSHQMPLFPGTGARDETGASNNIVNAPLAAGDAGKQFRDAWDNAILPALEEHAPDLIIVSAGFDAHHRDPLGSIDLTEDDFAWVTNRLVDIADEQCGGRLVSMLEGGYDLQGLSASVAAHVNVLMGR